MKPMLLILAVHATMMAREISDPQEIISAMTDDIKNINCRYEMLLLPKYNRVAEIEDCLLESNSATISIGYLIEKDRIHWEIARLREENASDISKVRYLKGLQIIKILYEKVLSLDHHFASVRTLSDINKIANPNQYPEYVKIKELVAAKKDKKSGFDLTALLGSNAIVSVVQTLTNLVTTSLTREEKEKSLAGVECILDFTLRMQNDLNTIYFETAYLQTSNDKIRQDIEVLFKDYTKPIGYTSTLADCRKNDDWEDITQKIDDYLSRMKSVSGTSQYKMQVNVEFPIDRLIQFIGQYNSFIDQGGKFYEKFSIILNSYENEKQCESRLSPDYKKLKSDIDLAIQKFNTAYKPVEINGSRMKEILYGINEFD